MAMIRYWDYREEYGKDRADLLALVDRVFSSGRLILGPAVSGFEQHFSAYCGTRYGIGVNSGTDALFLSLKALGIGPGDEVITVSNTAVPTVAAIRAAGAAPLFVDVEEDTFLMDPGNLEAAVTNRTKCILPVHLYGQPVDMDAVCSIGKRLNLFILEDCAQATGATYHGAKVGGFGNVAAFSFYPTKVLGAYGDGGMVVTADDGLHARLRRLRFYGMDKAYYSEEEGFSSRLDEVQAAILDLKLQGLDRLVQKRRSLALRYGEALAGTGDLVLPVVGPGRTHQFYAYTIKTRRRDALQQYLLEQGVETKVNYPVPIHLMRGYAGLGYAHGALPVTESLAGRILSLPMHPGLSSADVDQVADRIRKFFSRGLTA